MIIIASSHMVIKGIHRIRTSFYRSHGTVHMHIIIGICVIDSKLYIGLGLTLRWLKLEIITSDQRNLITIYNKIFRIRCQK